MLCLQAYAHVWRATKYAGSDIKETTIRQINTMCRVLGHSFSPSCTSPNLGEWYILYSPNYYLCSNRSRQNSTNFIIFYDIDGKFVNFHPSFYASDMIAVFLEELSAEY